MRHASRFAAAGLAALACSGDGAESGDPAVARGETIYRNICVTCHNADPSQVGSLGPAIAGASLELLEAKVLRGEYPPGHSPTRDSAQMPRFEYLAPQLPDLAAFLAKPRE